jgi:glycosyltransferase involved in cell wall biosynthesis
MNIEITIFTPTYNRCATLPRLYASLQEQSSKNFEWLIIDDGSTDGTAELVAEWQRTNAEFPIVYRWKPNGGKHTAHNLSLTLARGRYFAIMDSDDWYAPDGIKVLKDHWDRLGEDYVNYSNVEGLCAHPDGSLIGSRYPTDIFDSDNFSITYQRDKSGDTAGMYRLDVLKEFPFPNDENTFITEGLIWNRIANQYKTRFINVIIGFKEYLQIGLTNRTLRSKLKTAKYSCLYTREILVTKNNIPAKLWLRLQLNYIRYALHSGIPIRQQFREAPSRLYFIIFFIPGLLLYTRDQFLVFCEKNNKV